MAVSKKTLQLSTILLSTVTFHCSNGRGGDGGSQKMYVCLGGRGVPQKRTKAYKGGGGSEIHDF